MNKIAYIRKQRGITQSQMAKNLGIKQNSLSQYETGKRKPDRETLERIASYLGVAPDFLKDDPYEQFKNYNSYSYDYLQEIYIKQLLGEDTTEIEKKREEEIKNKTPSEHEIEILRNSQRESLPPSYWQQQRHYEKHFSTSEQIEIYNMIDTNSMLKEIETFQKNLSTLILFETTIAVKCNIINKIDIEKNDTSSIHKVIIEKLKQCNKKNADEFNELYATHIPSVLNALKRSSANILHDVDKKTQKSLLQTLLKEIQSE